MAGVFLFCRIVGTKLEKEVKVKEKITEDEKVENYNYLLLKKD